TVAGAIAALRPVNTVALVVGGVTTSEPHSTAPSPSDKPTKPSKPYPEFPLTPRRSVVQEDTGQDSPLRPPGRSRRCAREIPGTEGRPARPAPLQTPMP